QWIVIAQQRLHELMQRNVKSRRECNVLSRGQPTAARFKLRYEGVVIKAHRARQLFLAHAHALAKGSKPTPRLLPQHLSFCSTLRKLWVNGHNKLLATLRAGIGFTLHTNLVHLCKVTS